MDDRSSEIRGRTVRSRACPNGPRLRGSCTSLAAYQPRNRCNHTLSFPFPQDHGNHQGTSSHSRVAGGNRARAALFTKRSENGNCCKNLLAWEGSCSYPFAARKLGCYFAFNSLKNCEELSKWVATELSSKGCESQIRRLPKCWHEDGTLPVLRKIWSRPSFLSGVVNAN